MTTFTVGVFALVYLAMALGALPGFKVDRAGAALIGALALQVGEAITIDAAWQSVDYSTMALLFGLMVISAQLTMSGFYTAVTGWVSAIETGPRVLLAAIIVTAGALSAVLTNNVVAVAMAPLLVEACGARRLNPVPYLLALGFGANAGSVMTIIGSPQNIIVAQQLDLHFAAYSLQTIVPGLLAMAVIWLVLVWIYRDNWHREVTVDVHPPIIAYDRIETYKGLAVALAVLVIFVFTSLPREHVALAAAGLLMLNRRIASRDMLGQVDGSLLIILFGLFIVNAAFDQTGLPEEWIAGLDGVGISLQSPGWLFVVTAIVSDLVGNTPAVLLLIPVIQDPIAGVAITMACAFSSNLIVFGSLATIIVVEAAKDRGIRISFWEFLRAGLPITVVTLLFAFGWVMLLAAR